MTRRVSIRPAATEDIERFTLWIAAKVSATSAHRWQARVERCIDDLSRNADRWPEADEAVVIGMNLRARQFGRRPHVYRIVYSINGDRVIVYRVRHAAQDYLTEDDV